MKNNKHLNLTKVITTKSMGRGVASTRRIKPGQIIEQSPCIIIDRIDEEHLQKTDLKLYVFDTHFKGPDSPKNALALGIGSLFNHSKTPNVTYTFDQKTLCVVFIALKPIKRGEQLFINYGYNAAEQCERQQRMKDRLKKERKDANIKGPEWHSTIDQKYPSQLEMKSETNSEATAPIAASN